MNIFVTSGWGRVSPAPREDLDRAQWPNHPGGSHVQRFVLSNKQLGVTTSQNQTGHYPSMRRHDYTVLVISIPYSQYNSVGSVQSDSSVPSMGMPEVQMSITQREPQETILNLSASHP